MSWNLVLFAFALTIVTYFAARSPIGQRNPEERWPAWAERVGARDIPRIIRSDWFGWFGWLARRLLPLTMAMTATETYGYLTGQQPLFGLSALDWLAITSLLLAIYSGSYSFAKNPRRGPMDRWTAFLPAMLYVAGGVMFALVQVALVIFRADADGQSIIGRMAAWQKAHSLSESLGWAAGVIALGVTFLALVEGLPNWRDQRFGRIDDDIKNLDDQRMPDVSIWPEGESKLSQPPKRRRRRRKKRRR